ncbi:tRNA (adenosine(37)-N6)-dimethylallyltransferase MiaA [Leifsonia sp. C5G2]|uniref:tRNA (adenosine(37)-N6)-dimethylallyltransferase MiaA n=1 Tax=Leifsonia sp. C5G2 TaxID=2735269 RepID=UPI001584D114|nr:tRNA (adenosine(37)-N6)-dimethylallyltransferase MiaA [Leifsonia sp. C5G2]NUU08041.1 tRNA (adenosine(37)-N6)-dimethylallyltransferase MiaA [Leifsonia sp. C5G2]
MSTPAARTAPAAPPLVAIVGPTGTGKTDLSLALADVLRARGTAAEVVNADAMQLYRGMDIGTAKISPDEWRGIPHHLFDVLEVTDEATVARYQPEARAQIGDILARGAVPILVGGSGLYVSSVLFDLQFPGTDPELRARLEAELAEHGPGMLFQRLAERDPEAARRIGSRNGRRIVRALEVAELTGTSVSGTLPDEPQPWHRPTAIIGLSAPREELVQRLDARVDRMWAAGLLAEVSALIPQGIDRGVTARRAIGYAQALAELRGELTQEEAIAQTQQLTRRYARRQVSWFKRYPGIHWLEYDAADLVERALAVVDAA